MDKLTRLVISFCGTLWLQYSLYAQVPYQLTVIGDSSNVFSSEWKHTSFPDSVSARIALDNRVETIRHQGYWMANLDQLNIRDQLITAKIFLGKKMESINVLKTNLTSQESRKFSLTSKTLPKKIENNEIQDLKKQILKYQEDNGFPFAAIKLDSFQLQNSTLSCHLKSVKGPKILFDSLEIEDSDIINRDYLSTYLGIKYGANFDQSKIDQIASKIRHLTFLKLEKKPDVHFALQRAKVDIEVSQRKVNVFDGILGLVPGNENRSSDLTGELKLGLKNLFKSGKAFDFVWRKITSQTQQLNVNYEHPLFLRSPLNLQFTFNQLKENTNFSNRVFNIGMDYDVTPNTKLNFFYENKNGNDLDEINSDAGDFRLNNYGLIFEVNGLDNFDFPRKGILAELTAQVGLKNVPVNSSVGSINSNQYQLNASVKSYLRVTEKTVLYVGLSGGLIDNQNLFLNDLFRLGGLKSIRGFNENFFFASQYLLGNVEWQWYLEPESYIFVFFDQAALRREIFSSTSTEYPSGAGMGLKLNTNNGFFNIIYGVGGTNRNGFSFDQSKIHFGYTGRF